MLDWIIFLAVSFYGSGWVFFRALGYMEGKPVLRRQVRRVMAVPVSCTVTLLNLGLMRGWMGFSAHILAEALASLALAALLAAAVSALLCAFRQNSVRRRHPRTAPIRRTAARTVPGKRYAA